MTEESVSVVCEAAGVWPVRLTVGGVSGWSLWCAGETDVLLARGGRVQLFNNPGAMLDALAAPEDDLTPAAVVGLSPDVLRRVATAPAATADLDAAAAWFSRVDRPATVEDCDRALTAINMAIDIGATTGDPRLAALVESDDLRPVVDALTFGLTLLGDGSPYSDNPEAMAGVITPKAAAAVVRLVELMAGHVEAR